MITRCNYFLMMIVFKDKAYLNEYDCLYTGFELIRSNHSISGWLKTRRRKIGSGGRRSLVLIYQTYRINALNSYFNTIA